MPLVTTLGQKNRSVAAGGGGYLQVCLICPPLTRASTQVRQALSSQARGPESSRIPHPSSRPPARPCMTYPPPCLLPLGSCLPPASHKRGFPEPTN